MVISIYFNDKPLFLCDDIDETVQPFIHHDDAIFIDELDVHAIKSMIHEMQEPRVHAGVYYHTDLEELKKAFWKKFTVIKAAGGLVINDVNQSLMIFRRGKWDLPKGKLDKGEKLEECALREISEETGLKKLKLISPLVTTYHTYHEGTKFILKESYWFLVKADGNEIPSPQVEEDIHEVKWVNEGEVPAYLQESFPTIAEVFKAIAGKTKTKKAG